MTDTGEQGERAVETPGQRYYVLTIYSNHYENFADAEDHTFVTFEAHLSTVRELLSTLMYELLWTRTDPYRIEVRRVYTGKVWRRGTLVGNVDGGGSWKNDRTRGAHVPALRVLRHRPDAPHRMARRGRRLSPIGPARCCGYACRAPRGERGCLARRGWRGGLVRRVEARPEWWAATR